MLENKTIFVMGATKFDGVFESTSFTTAKYLAQCNDVYYVDFPFTIKDYFSKALRSAINKRKPYFKNTSDGLISTVDQKLNIIILPLLLSINFLPEGKLYRLLLRWNEGLILKRLRKVIKVKNINELIFINSFNFHYPNIGKRINPILSVYHCVDPLIIGYDMKHGFVSQQIVVQQSDLVVCTSKQLFREQVRFNPNTFFIPNAADLKLSAQALNESLKVHDLLLNIPKPIIGYFGHIERRMDFKMLFEVVEANPYKSFVFVGPVSEEFVPAGFKELTNVYFLGSVPYLEMPAVIKGFDIAMIPFKRDEVSITIFPLKLFEYLGAGKPVIATDFNLDLKEFTGEAVSYCKNATSFNEAICFYLNNDTKIAEAERINIAAENTWEKRLSEFSELMCRFINQTNSKTRNG